VQGEVYNTDSDMLRLPFTLSTYRGSRPPSLSSCWQDFLAELFSAIEPKSVAAVGEDKAGREARSARLRATATATAYAYASKHFTWKFGVLQNVYLKCKTNSREVGDIAAAHTPGYPSYNTVVAMCKKIAAEWEEDFELDADTMLIDMIKPTQQSGATPKKNSKKRGKRG
jgi:hypothetical protein